MGFTDAASGRVSPGLFITPQSQIRTLSPQLEPHGSEMTRPWGFVLRWRRDRVSFSADSQGLATLARLATSLSRRRARRDLFTRAALRRPISGPNSLPSLCLARPGLTGVGFALSVATPQGWVPRVGRNKNETWSAAPGSILNPNLNGFFPQVGQLKPIRLPPVGRLGRGTLVGQACRFQ